MRIIAGRLGGRRLHFSGTKFNNAETTPQKIKGALFSIIGEDLAGLSFLDLFAGSGQIGIEAISRGASPVVFNEVDKKKFAFIKRISREWDLLADSVFYNLEAFTCLRTLHALQEAFEYIFLDPPYIKEKGEVRVYQKLFKELIRNPVFVPSTTIIVQHFGGNIFREEYEQFRLTETRYYGSNALSFFSII